MFGGKVPPKDGCPTVSRAKQAKDKEFKKMEEELQTLRKFKAEQEDKKPGEAETGGTDEDHKKVAEAKKDFDELNNLKPNTKVIIPNFEELLASKLKAWQDAKAKAAEGKPLDSRLKAAESRLNGAKKALEKKNAAKTEAHEAWEEAKKKLEAEMKLL